MPKSTITLVPNSSNNTISFNGKSVIINMIEPMTTIVNISSILESIEYNDNNPADIDRYFRYSKDGKIWSMWHPWTPFADENINRISVLQFNPKDDLYFSFKYEYNMTNSPETSSLDTPIVINSIGMVIYTNASRYPLRMDVSALKCFGESCPENLFDKNSKLDLYDIGNMVDFYKSMSYSMNVLAGIQICYFYTTPDESGTDYIFREYSLYNIASRKCIKAVVPDNEFGAPEFKYVSTDMSFANEESLTLHIDKAYFEEFFGKRSEPRKKDFLYIPMLNRVYEIINVEMFRGVMMVPIYWEISLRKFKPNINMQWSLDANKEHSELLDNMVLTSYDQFGEEAKYQEKNAVLDSQYSNEGEYKNSGEPRYFLDQALNVRETEFNYNYTRLFNYYYDMGSVINSSGLGVIYNEYTTLDDKTDATIMFSFQLLDTTSGELRFVTTEGTDSKLNIFGNYNNRTKRMRITIELNGNTYDMDVDAVATNKWYSLIACILPKFNQIGMYLYEFITDKYDSTNSTKTNLMMHALFDNCANMNISSKKRFALSRCIANVANFRIFNRSIDEEKHEYALSQLIVKDEGMLRIIDNCRPKLGMPFIMKKY